MEKLGVGKKCTISNELESLVVSFKKANIRWKKKYKRYLGQKALVLSLFGTDTVMLKMENGQVYKFPKDCIERSEATRDEFVKGHETCGHSNMTLTSNDQLNVFGDKCNSITFSREVVKQEFSGDQSFKDNEAIPVNKEYADLNEVLEALNLQKYYRNLVREGCVSLKCLERIQFSDLVAIGLKRGHARRLIRAMNEHRANPSFKFRDIERYLRKRNSFGSSRSSLISSSSSWQSSSISQLSIPEYEPYAPNDYENPHMIDNLSMKNSFGFELASSELEAVSARRSSFSSSSFSESHSNGTLKDGGYMIIPFVQRPLGFGIMSRISVGSIVSSITDCRLKLKGLCLGLPLLRINKYDVSKCNIEETANRLSSVELPFTLTFGMKPDLKSKQRVMAMRNTKWYPCTVKRKSIRPRKVTVKYDGSSFKLNNIEKISRCNRIKHTTQKQFSTKVVRNNATCKNRPEVSKKSPTTPSGFEDKHLSCKGNRPPSGRNMETLLLQQYFSNRLLQTSLKEIGITPVCEISRLL